MKNIFGKRIGKNGYVDSIVGDEQRCFLCGRRDRGLHRHEVYHGISYREKSKNLGLWVNLCYECHDRLHHHDASLDRKLKEEMQRRAMSEFGWSIDDFRREFGKSYLGDS